MRRLEEHSYASKHIAVLDLVDVNNVGAVFRSAMAPQWCCDLNC